MTPDELSAYVAELKEWQREHPTLNTRPALAAELGISKGTLDNWCSKGFPEWGMKAIDRLRNPTTLIENTDLEVTFSAREFERIEEARRLLGIATRKLYYEEAIMEYTAQILAREEAEEAKTKAPQNISYLSQPEQTAKVAEDPPKYDGKTGTED